jgi:Fe-S cluster assembly protein SufD
MQGRKPDALDKRNKMNIIDTIKEKYQSSKSGSGSKLLAPIEQNAFEVFSRMGIPTARHEEWKYTRVNSLFNKEYQLANSIQPTLSATELDRFRLPEYEMANELVFVNGLYSASLSVVRSPELIVMSLEEASKGQYSDIVTKHLGHSSNYIKDGIHALNTAFVHGGVFIHIAKGQITEHPVYIYNITDARSMSILSQPRALIHIGEQSQVQFTESYATIGDSDSFVNQVLEIIVEKDANVEYYKIQNDSVHTSQVNTTHFRQVGKSYVHTVTITLDGGMIRNNLNIVLDAERSEAQLHGLYFLKGQNHVDNHTTVDNVKPNCLSNELYKGIIDDNATAVFNGKIFVQQPAQKTNAYQSNKNVLLSDNASVNTKPQLEIFADDVKCSHGCTVGKLDEEGLFYLRSRGIGEEAAKALLVHAFAIDILEHIKPEAIRSYVDQLISERLEIHIS